MRCVSVYMCQLLSTPHMREFDLVLDMITCSATALLKTAPGEVRRSDVTRSRQLLRRFRYFKVSD